MMDYLIHHMRLCGWDAIGEVITGPQGQVFSTWIDAIKACITVASEA